MTTQKLELSADTVLVKLFGSVSGITRRTNKEDEHRDGRAVETTREVTTRQADEGEATKAKKLLNQLRATVDKYCSTVINITVTTAAQLPAMRAEIAPIQAQIETHNAAAKHHFIDRALIMAPIALRADPAALTEVCRQISDELKAAWAFFEPEAYADKALSDWQGPVDNWLKRTKGLGSLFPTVTGQCIGDAIESVRDLRKRVGDLARAGEKAGQTPESALKSALTTITSIDGALGLLDSAIGLTAITRIGLTAITSTEAKAASDTLRAEGGGIDGVH